jgi:HPr kinase/phosphorylase
MTPAVTVRGLLDARPESVGLAIELLAGAGGLHRRITSPYIQKTGLALAGFHEYLQAGRILLFGESEVRFLESLEANARRDALAKCFTAELPCLLVTGGAEIAAEVVTEGERANVPILRTPVPTAAAIGKLTAVLEDRLAHREIIHGVLIDILGLGVLIVGESGIGKSECALDLVVRGHRLVADDTVEVRRRSESIVIGACPELTRHHMEVRGLGLINIRDLFGVASTRTSKRIELVVQLDRWDTAREYDRLGLDEASYDLMGLKVPLIRMPVATGRNLAILVEVAARNQLLRMRGINAARELVERLDATLAPGTLAGGTSAPSTSAPGTPAPSTRAPEHPSTPASASAPRTSRELRRDLAEAAFGREGGPEEDEELA